MRGEAVMSKRFGRRLKELRDGAHMTQEAVGRAADISTATVVKLERGETDPKWSTVRALAKALGVQIAAFDVEDEPATDAPASPENPSKPAKKKPNK